MEELGEIVFQHFMTRSITTTLSKLSVAEAAYLAGLIDGDGCFFIEKIKKKNRKRELTGIFGYVPSLRVTNTNKFLAELCNQYGGFWITEVEKDTWKRVYRWILSTRLCKFYIPQLLPYLKIRYKQAQVMLSALEECHGTGYPQNKVKMEQYRKELQRLNMRGKKKGRLP